VARLQQLVLTAQAFQARIRFEDRDRGCERLERTEQGHGILHWVRVELAAPGIELYVTPLDPSAWNTAFSIDCAGS
jgi:hypothetical protein